MARAPGSKRGVRQQTFQHQQSRLPQPANPQQQQLQAQQQQQYQPIMITSMHQNQPGLVQHPGQGQYTQIQTVQQIGPTQRPGMMANRPHIMLQSVQMPMRLSQPQMQQQTQQQQPNQQYYQVTNQGISAASTPIIVQGGVRMSTQQLQPGQYQQIHSPQIGGQLPHSPQTQPQQQQMPQIPPQGIIRGARMAQQTIVQGVRKQAPIMVGSVASPSNQQNQIRFQQQQQLQTPPQQHMQASTQSPQMTHQQPIVMQPMQVLSQPQQIQHPQQSQMHQQPTMQMTSQSIIQRQQHPQIVQHQVQQQMHLVQVGNKKRVKDDVVDEAVAQVEVQPEGQVQGDNKKDKKLDPPVVLTIEELRDPLIAALEKNKNKHFFSHTLHRTFGPALALLDHQ